MYYTCLHVRCESEFSEILMAEIAEAGFETFLETETGFEAYVELEKFDPSVLQEISDRYSTATEIGFRTERVRKENWNEQWEKSYTPILVENKCLIRAAFHKPDPAVPFEVVITPKMSFGTGHHQTTYLMVKNQLAIDHAGKRVMDAGCGTAILSIVASKLGASQVEAFDIDEWSITNGNENLAVNNCNNVRIQQGNISEVHLTGTFDIILANINKNVLLSEIKTYSQHLNSGGHLLLSGFYVDDCQDIIDEANSSGLTEILRDDRENWASLLLQKN
jgi:ribosomal protein L11 methyltransferase